MYSEQERGKNPLVWWGYRDSNPHVLRHRNLNPKRLPYFAIPPYLQRHNDCEQIISAPPQFSFSLSLDLLLCVCVTLAKIY